MDALQSLKVALANANTSALAGTPFAVDLQPTIRLLRSKLNSTSQSTEPQDRVQNSINSFWNIQRVDDLQVARYISFGLSIPTRFNNQTLFHDQQRFSSFLSQEIGVGQWKGKPSWFRRVLQGLIASYFSFDSDAIGTTEQQKRNWLLLRDYISRNLVFSKGVVNPDWLNCCLDHPSLFSDYPGDDFVEIVLAGKTEQLERTLELLRAKDSWLPRELILSQVKKITSFDDARFMNFVSPMLSAITPHRSIQNKAIALLVNRYAQVKNISIHSELKEITVKRWDNPWLTGSNKKWPSEVTEEGRALIADWLKSEFIEAFFTKMAEDGNTDRRRLDFWMKYRKHMNHVHFALGADILESTDPDLIFLRNKMNGLISTIRSKRVNAFIMYLGDVIAVEFSQMGNALYFYDASNGAPFDLQRSLGLTVDLGNSLKKSSGLRFKHQDAVNGFSIWESACFSFMARKFGIHPDKAPNKDAKPFVSTEAVFRYKPATPAEDHKIPVFTQQSKPVPPPINVVAGVTSDLKIPVFIEQSKPVPLPINVVSGVTSWAELYNYPFSETLLTSTCSAFGFDVQDKRSIGGALWVNIGTSNSERNRVFINWGFRYKADKGWWKN